MKLTCGCNGWDTKLTPATLISRIATTIASILHQPPLPFLISDCGSTTFISAHSHGSFGVGTNIQEIWLTVGLVWGGRLLCNRSLERCLDVNKISWIVVCTPKLPSESAQEAP